MEYVYARTLFFAAALAALLTACGGGGGSGSVPPQAPGGNGGAPSPAPSSSYSPAPTPAPTHTPVSAPTPVPTPTPNGSTILGNTTGLFAPVQILDRRMTTSQIQSEAPYEDLVWGAFSPSSWNAYHPGMIVSRYLMPFDDDYSISGHDLAWWEQNHPDWILYACDQNGNPTHDVARDDGFPNVLLDIHNPQVIQYQMQTVGPYMIANGYNALAADNITFANYTGGPNSLLGQSVPGENYGSDGWYGCGIWEGSTFVRRYTLGYDKPDPAFISDIVNWVETVRSMLNSDPSLAPYRLHFIVNHPMGLTSDPNEQAIFSHVDAMSYEASFSNWNRFHANFPNIIQYMQYGQANHVAMIDINYFCQNNGTPCETSVTPSQLEFAMAAHQLANEGASGLYISPSTGDIYSYHPEYQTHLGTPCSEYTTVGTDMYARRFSNGLVVVNNGTAAQAYALPSNHTYSDIEGRSLTNPLTVNVDDGYVLTTTGNGCV
ncbi:MAG TPA: hypothetical protein VKT72_00575 [Candidatus Baltobacteraceae bacterium]|nr:hypothetical protein [Candidatus Baltobacteraceae bacterium]